MTYRQTFDRLGRPVARPMQPTLAHRALRWASVLAIVVGLALLAGGA